jgi:hypothetical protein
MNLFSKDRIMTKDQKTETNEAPGAFYVSTVKGENKTEPTRLDGWEFKFPTIPLNASLQDATAFLRERSENEEAAVGFLRNAWEDTCEKARKAWHNAYATGKRGDPDRKQRSEICTQEEAAEFAAGFRIEAPASTTGTELRRTKQELSAAHTAILDTLRMLADVAPDVAAEKLAAFKAAGSLPADAEL